METLQLNLPIYKFKCSESLLLEVESGFENQIWHQDPHNYNTDQFFHHDLFSWFNECVREVQAKHMNQNFSLDIVSCWVNKNNKLMRSPRHAHINSVLSGVLYFSDEKTSPLVFQFPDPYVYMQQQNCLFISDKDPYIKTIFYPERGTCIIFPSSILHETLPHRDLKPRYSIAFNTFPSGLLTDNPTMKLDILSKFQK